MAKIKDFVLLHILFFVSSFSLVMGKCAAVESFFSPRFLMFYGANLFILFVYSIFWQFVLRKFSLTMAYSNRGVLTIWGIMWGVFLFGEHINIATIIAIAFIFAGIAMTGEENE
jgi:drug/metabolite transporter (DMT)-like permease